MRDAAACLAAAFHAGVLFGWAQPDEARRAVGLRGVFAGTLRHCRRLGGVEVVQPGALGARGDEVADRAGDAEVDARAGDAEVAGRAGDAEVADRAGHAEVDGRAGDAEAGGGGPAAVAGWVPAASLDLGTLDLLRSGLIATPLWLGPQATVRLERHERPAERRLVAHRRPGDAYLWVLGAHPQVQGTGRGGAALEAALVAMAAAGHDRCLLRTDDPPNVPWYERHGFEVVEHLDDLASGLPAWVLARPLG